MSEWRDCNLSDVIELVGGGTPKTSITNYWNGDIPWLSVVDFNTGKKYVEKTEKAITKAGLENSSTTVLHTGDIIISARGTVGAIAVLKKPMAFNQSCYGIRGVNNISDCDYLYYLTKASIIKFQQIAHGGVFDTITRETFKSIDISLPPLSEQKAIAGVLSSLDDKIDLLHRQNKTLEAMAETLFRQWFVEEAEEDWDVGVIPDEFDFSMGQSPPGSSYNQEGIGMPLFQGNADFGFRFPEERVYTTDSKRLAHLYDTLISVRAPVGAQNMAKAECCIGRGVAAFRYMNNNNLYTYTYFKLRSLMGEIKKFNDEGTVFGSIGKTDFQQMKITVPPEDLIEKFERKAKPLNDKVNENTKQIQTLEDLRDTILPKLISGEVRVNKNYVRY
jgi:type I restriction enzyme, S subunit